MFEVSDAIVTASTGGFDPANLEVWVVLTNVGIVIATLMLTRVTAKDAMLHEEKIVDKANESTHDLTEILHDVLVRDGLVQDKKEAPKDEDEAEVEPLRAVN